MEARCISSRNGRFVLAVALVATVACAEIIGTFVPSVGAPALALLFGMAFRLRYAPPASDVRLLAVASRMVLQAAIVLLGLTIGLTRVVAIGWTSLPLMIGTVMIVLAAARLAGNLLGVKGSLQTLIGVGTAICGASAIAAVSNVIEVDAAEIAYAVSTIFAFNVVAVVLYPALGHALGLNETQFGLWAGTAVNDTSSVVAAATTYGHTAAVVATVTKLARTTMIIPITLALAFSQTRRTRARSSVRRAIPTFLLVFVVAGAANSAGWVSPHLSVALSRTASIFIAVALGAIGLSTPVSELRRAGPRPFLLGAALWATVGVSGVLLQHPF